MDPDHERYGEASEARSLIETDHQVKTIFETARGLEGLVRNAGVHACAVIMSSEPLLRSIPLWQRDDGSIITGCDGLVPLDLTSPGEAPLVLHAQPGRVTEPVVLELGQTLRAHRGTTPVHVHVGQRRFALDDYPVEVTAMLLGELKAIPGITASRD